MTNHPALSLEPVNLEGIHTRLELLAPEHAEGIFEAGRDPTIWRYMFLGPFVSIQDAAEWIDESTRLRTAMGELPYAIVHRPTGRIAGSTRYLNVDRQSRGLEIG